LVPVASFALISTPRGEDDATVRIVVATTARIGKKIFSFLNIINVPQVILNRVTVSYIGLRMDEE
jgi:hypothetical protein